LKTGEKLKAGGDKNRRQEPKRLKVRAVKTGTGSLKS